MDEFDFVKAFSGVDMLQAGAIAKIVGRIEGELYLGLIDVGLEPDLAIRIMEMTMRSVINGFVAAIPRSKD